MTQTSIEDAMKTALEHHRAERFAEAEAIYRRVLQVQPQNPDAYYLLGHLALDLKQPQVAAELFRRALSFNADPAHYHFKLAHAMEMLNQPDAAIVSYDAAIARKPDFSEALSDRGISLKKVGRIDDSFASFEAALKVDPKNYLALTNLGGAYHAKGDLENAIPLYKRALELYADHQAAHSNLGLALAQQGLFDEAIKSYEKALAIQPDFVDAHANLSLSLLVRGEFERGWEEYDWRRQLADFPSTRRSYPQPMWDGSDPTGKTILIFSEQGFGDSIQFSRYAPMVTEMGAKVIFETQPPVRNLFEGFDGVERVVTGGDPRPPFDLQIPLLSLPRIFKTRVENIPARPGYLKADPHRVAKWKERLAGDKNFKVGLVWAGNPKNFIDRLRSCSLAAFAPLAKLDGVSFYSLQKGDASKQAANPPAGMTVIDYTEELHDFADTAGLIQNLDLVLSIETAVAHLAGAIMKPVWTLVSAVPAWQWLLERPDTPWYPSMRLMRQTKLGDWQSVLDRVAVEMISHFPSVKSKSS